MDPVYVPWDFVAEHGQQAERNHYQTVKRLAERGGLAWAEMLAVVTDTHWREINPKADYRALVLKLLDEWEAARK